MPLSLRLPPEKEKMIQDAANREGKSKSAFILSAVDEKLGPVINREELIRKFAGWLSHDEAEELREATRVFRKVNEADWE